MNQDTKAQIEKHTPREITDTLFMWAREEGMGIRKARKRMDHSLNEYLGEDKKEVDFLLGIPGIFSLREIFIREVSVLDFLIRKRA